MLDVMEIDGVKLSQIKRHGDGRGFFCELFRVKDHAGVDFVQDNVSLSAEAGTIRGLHFQTPPFAQAKLVTVLRGAVLDVAVDLRRGSPTYGRSFSAELSAETLKQLFIPAGFAHGFCTLVPDTLVLYKAGAYYSPAHDRGIFWDDPSLGIHWPVDAALAVVSDKDRRLPRLSEIESPFAYHP